MSLLELSQRPAGDSTPGLTATRHLAILDELRAPYGRSDAGSADGQWAALSGPDPRRALLWFTGPGGELAAGWSLGSMRIWGHVASEADMTALMDSLEGQWDREAPVVDPAGAVRSWVWRSPRGGTILPFDPDEVVANLRTERYLRFEQRRVGSRRARARRTYYAIRPLLPRTVQIALRRGYSRVQARSTFPRWPVEPTLHDLTELVLQRAADAAAEPLPYLASWPRGHSWALVLTHDVETGVGRDAIETVRAVEESAGYRSAWNLVPERYAVPDRVVEHLQAVGCEVGVHGLRHDGRDLESLDTRLPAMQQWGRRWGAVGFRSPATHRAWDLMPQLGFAYDSSYPDTDPYEPMPGGCCSWLPFFNRGMVELPVTMTQDHTVFVILRRDDSLWREKVEFLRARGGMALVLVHPDYVLEGDRLDAYARLLDAFRDDPEMWTPLPREVADWWRRRAATSLRLLDGAWRPVGPGADEVAVAFAHPATTTGVVAGSSTNERGEETHLHLADGPGRIECV